MQNFQIFPIQNDLCLTKTTGQLTLSLCLLVRCHKGNKEKCRGQNLENIRIEKCRYKKEENQDTNEHLDFRVNSDPSTYLELYFTVFDSS